jgi:hypothetical protein
MKSSNGITIVGQNSHSGEMNEKESAIDNGAVNSLMGLVRSIVTAPLLNGIKLNQFFYFFDLKPPAISVTSGVS